LEDQLVFDSEIERTTPKNNRKTRKRKELNKQRRNKESNSLVIIDSIPLLDHERSLGDHPH